MKLVDYKRFVGNFTGMFGRNAECYADVVLPKLSQPHNLGHQTNLNDKSRIHY
jgi:hypothetical protein